jgi:hypothetical protein
MAFLLYPREKIFHRQEFLRNELLPNMPKMKEVSRSKVLEVDRIMS